jgi:hypothetical protein
VLTSVYEAMGMEKLSFKAFKQKCMHQAIQDVDYKASKEYLKAMGNITTAERHRYLGFLEKKSESIKKEAQDNQDPRMKPKYLNPIISRELSELAKIKMLLHNKK